MGESVTGWWLGLWSDITHRHSALSHWTWDESDSAGPGQTGQIKLMIAFLDCPLPAPGAAHPADVSSDLWCEVWGDHRYPPSPPRSHQGGQGPPRLSCVPRGEPGKHIPDFWTVWPLPQGPTVTNWRDWQLAWPALSKLCIPKIRTPTISQSPAIQLLYFDFFLFHNKSYLASPGERSATLQQFLVFAWKSLTPKKEAFFLGDGYLELNIWNSNQSNENFVRS